MAQISTLQARLTRVQARIAEIEAVYPDIIKHKSYSKGFGETSATYQDFGAVAKEYERLLAQESALQDQVDALSGTYTTSGIAAFYGPQ